MSANIFRQPADHGRRFDSVKLPAPRRSADKITEEEVMLLDVRTYTCRPGTIKKHIALYEKMGKGPQTRQLGQPFASLTTESGNVN